MPVAMQQTGLPLKVRGLEKVFAHNGRVINAIEAISLDVVPGEFVSIVGPSGCGKSTFLHIVGGFERASAGTIELGNEPITGPGPDRGMMFQDLSLFPWLTVMQNVCWPLEMKGLPRPERLTRAKTILNLVHLGRFEGLYPAQLSGGMRQRVALARLLALDPQMLLMDEPFGALDAQTRELLQDDLQSLWRRDRKTALFVTHDIDEAIYLGTRVIVFSARPGRIKADINVSVGVERTPEFRNTAEYTKLRIEVWDLLREEVLRARAENESEAT
jgi:NitT/TauT family transport system ATP-binding protein